MTPDTITVDGVQYVRAYHVADGNCPHCGGSFPSWLPGQIVDVMRRFVAAHGRVPKSDEFMGATPTRPNRNAVIRVFGSWSRALRESGYAIPPRGSWNRERIIEAMRGYYARTGEVPTMKAWEAASTTTPAAQQVRYHFGTWNAAMDAAGFYPRGPYGVRLRVAVPNELIGKVDGAPVANVIRAEVATGNTLRNIARVCGVDESYLSKIVKGKKVLRADYADRILCALDRPHVFAEAAA